MSENFIQLSQDYQRIEQAIKYLEKNSARQPALSDVAQSVHLSEFHFQRLFTQWAGISPKRFLQFLTKENAKEILAQTNLLEATYASGLSSPSRLHDLFVQCEAASPGEYKTKGAGVNISYGFHPTPFGECLLAVTPRGICFLAFVQNDHHNNAIKELKLDWENASFQENPSATRPYIERIFAQTSTVNLPIKLHLRGTNFQIKVWEALLKIPSGGATTYEDLAAFIDQPKAARAVANAVATNPVAYLIPCHRVLRKTGEFGNYRYGPLRKKAMLVREGA